jgi:hypothetical protein
MKDEFGRVMRVGVAGAYAHAVCHEAAQICIGGGMLTWALCAVPYTLPVDAPLGHGPNNPVNVVAQVAGSSTLVAAPQLATGKLTITLS